MSNKSVYAIAISEGQANQIVDSLTKSGFSSNDISVLFPDKDTTHQFSHEKNTKAPEGAVTGAADWRGPRWNPRSASRYRRPGNSRCGTVHRSWASACCA